MNTREPRAPDVSNEHCRDAPAAAKYDMYRHGDVVTKGEVVKHVDGAEKDDVGDPYDQRDCSGFEEERRVRGGEVGRPCHDCHEEELADGDEEAWTRRQYPG